MAAGEICRHVDSETGLTCNRDQPYHAGECCLACWSREYRRRQKRERLAEMTRGHPDNVDDFVRLMYSMLDGYKPLRGAYVLYLATGRETPESRGFAAHLLLLAGAVSRKQMQWYIARMNEGLSERNRIPDM